MILKCISFPTAPFIRMPYTVDYNPFLGLSHIKLGGTINTNSAGQVKGKDSSQFTHGDFEQICKVIIDVIHQSKEKQLMLNGIMIDTGTDTGALLGNFLSFALSPLLVDFGVSVCLTMASHHQDSPLYDGPLNRWKAMQWLTKQPVARVALAVDKKVLPCTSSKKRSSSSRCSFDGACLLTHEDTPSTECTSEPKSRSQPTPTKDIFRQLHLHALRVGEPLTLGRTTVIAFNTFTTAPILTDVLTHYLDIQKDGKNSGLIISGHLSLEQVERCHHLLQAHPTVLVLYAPMQSIPGKIPSNVCVLDPDRFGRFPKDFLQLKLDLLLGFMPKLRHELPNLSSQEIMGELMASCLYNEYDNLYDHRQRDLSLEDFGPVILPPQLDVNTEFLSRLLQSTRVSLGAYGAFNLNGVGDVTPQDYYPHTLGKIKLTGSFESRLEPLGLNYEHVKRDYGQLTPLNEVLIKFGESVSIYSMLECPVDRFTGYAPELIANFLGVRLMHSDSLLG